MWIPEYKGKIASPDITTGTSLFLLTAADMNGGGLKNTDPGFELLKKL